MLLKALQCPRTGQPAEHPMVLSDGHTYDEGPGLTTWLSQNKTSPKTGLPLLQESALPNRTLQAVSHALQNGDDAALELALTCPIRQALFFKPIMDEQGHTYSGDALMQWHWSDAAQSNQSPLTRQLLWRNMRYNHAVEQCVDIVLSQQHPVHRAILQGSYADLSEATLKMHINSTDAHGQTPLLLAAKYGDVHAMTLCLRAGADVDATDAAGQTPLHVAVTRHHMPVAKALLAAQARLDGVDQFNMFPLAVAAALCDLPMVHLLLHANADVNQCTDRTALHCAVYAGRVPTLSETLKTRSLQTVRLLMRHGANPFAKRQVVDRQRRHSDPGAVSLRSPLSITLGEPDLGEEDSPEIELPERWDMRAVMRKSPSGAARTLPRASI